jgi:hypothetical protein
VSGSTGQTATLTLALTEASGTVSGSGSLTLSGASISVQASGSYADTHAAITVSAAGFQDMTLTTTVGAQAMTGDLNGSGFDHRAITLTRQ